MHTQRNFHLRKQGVVRSPKLFLSLKITDEEEIRKQRYFSSAQNRDPSV